ncbi:SAM-dependent methyltransferase [Mesoterricola silvestris]|uniref:SAM-dependent methyltransferase n=1 Tax=Mesoterricola silvestris TaxID=2927979 RepID=A0AA48K854_9BACT|nr:SAM-dependent methyltransferase [Mesoterricola silvestris]BDU70987.1 SAM-dependent methyltransferase [Mesoterricola silvestris]
MTDLKALVEARLAQGPLPAAEAMALALYHPEFGYYRRAQGPWGFEGADYYTALDLGPLLGEALAVRLERAWERLGRPDPFVVLEPGAGRGWLGRDLLQAAGGAFGAALRYLHRDDNPAAAAAARLALAPHLASGRARIVAQAEPLEPFRGAILSNELFDALPAQPYRWDGEGWSYEALTVDGPAWLRAEPCDAIDWFTSQAEGGLEAGDGAPWCADLPGLVGDLARVLKGGLFLAIDYGHTASRVLDKGSDLRRYKGHTVDGAWWEEMGRADLTADVDFTRLALHLERAGLGEAGHVSLSAWIRDHAPLATWEAAWQTLDAASRVKRMENLLQLTLPTAMGERFRVLEAWRSCD